MSKASVEPIYADALNLAENRSATPKNIARVTEATSPEAARWAFTQWDLRSRAEAKFSHAKNMLFDREGMEMATHERLAEYHASQFPGGALVYDLTAGIGADLIALARRGPAIGFEIDAGRAELARYNLIACAAEAEVRAQSWESLGDAGYIYLDPARRSGGRRTLDPSEFQPNPMDVLARFKSLKLGLVKLSPMLPHSFLESLGSKLEFLSFGAECREALVFLGTEAASGRFAIHVESGERLESCEIGPGTPDLAEFLYDADPAAIRAHALGTLARRYELSLLGDSNGYLTGREIETTPWLKPFHILSSNRFDLAWLKKELERLDSSTPILKQKAAGQDLDSLRRKLTLQGSRELAVALYPVGKSLRCAVLEAVR